MWADATPLVVGQIRGVSFALHSAERRPPSRPASTFQTVSRETVWKVGGGFLIACVSCFKRTRWDIFALFWLIAILQIEAYWDFPDSLWKRNSRKLDFRFTEFSE